MPTHFTTPPSERRSERRGPPSTRFPQAFHITSTKSPAIVAKSPNYTPVTLPLRPYPCCTIGGGRGQRAIRSCQAPTFRQVSPSGAAKATRTDIVSQTKPDNTGSRRGPATPHSRHIGPCVHRFARGWAPNGAGAQ